MTNTPKNGFATDGHLIPLRPPQPLVNIYRKEGKPSSGLLYKWSPELQCGLKRMIYDYDGQWAVLELPQYHCTSMSGAINFVRRSFPDVKQIQTYAGGVPDTLYWLADARWKAGWHPDHPEHGDPEPELSEKQVLA